jgi:hypothetical protein
MSGMCAAPTQADAQLAMAARDGGSRRAKMKFAHRQGGLPAKRQVRKRPEVRDGVGYPCGLIQAEPRNRLSRAAGGRPPQGAGSDTKCATAGAIGRAHSSRAAEPAQPGRRRTAPLGGRKRHEVRDRGGYISRRRAGKRITSRMLGLSVSSIISRSMPTPQPPVGGMPYSRARMKSWS